MEADQCYLRDRWLFATEYSTVVSRYIGDASKSVKMKELKKGHQGELPGTFIRYPLPA